ncbi:hypothetical protein ACF0H5_014957 [Mactra antiquata]
MGNCCDKPSEAKYTPREPTKDETVQNMVKTHTKRIQELESTNKKLNEDLQNLATENKRMHGLESTNKKLHAEFQSLATENKRLSETNKTLVKESKTKEKLQQNIKSLEQKLNALTDENEKLKTRLSAALSTMITDGNTAIADLSDENRPTNLATQYTELYDNQWTDAYEYLTLEEQMTELEAIITLRNIFIEIYRTCQKKANNDMNSLTRVLAAFFGGENREMKKQFKDKRKTIFQRGVQDIEPEIKDVMKRILSKEQTMKAKEVFRFIDESSKIAWLMVIQDPPMYVDVDTDREGQTFDTDAFRPYTKTGAVMEYVVWPVVYLARGEAMVAKGVAQGKKAADLQKSMKQQPLRNETTRTGTYSNTQHQTSTEVKQEQKKPDQSSQPLLTRSVENTSQRQEISGTNQPKQIKLSQWPPNKEVQKQNMSSSTTTTITVGGQQPLAGKK